MNIVYTKVLSVFVVQYTSFAIVVQEVVIGLGARVHELLQSVQVSVTRKWARCQLHFHCLMLQRSRFEEHWKLEGPWHCHHHYHPAAETQREERLDRQPCCSGAGC